MLGFDVLAGQSIAGFGATDGGAFAVAGCGVVDLAVTVVVEVVSAYFLGGDDLVLAGGPFALVAAFGAALAGTFSVGSCWSTIARVGQAFVDLSIAVIVKAVAIFFGGGLFALALAPCAVVACPLSAFAVSCALCSGWSRVAVTCGEVVDFAVAVVIFAITLFFGWEGTSDTCPPLSVDALSFTERAVADAFCVGWSEITFLVESVVYLAVAVIVDAIACFG